MAFYPCASPVFRATFVTMSPASLIRHLVLCCLALLFINGAFAQRYPFYNLGVEQGLIQSQATAMVQDKAGHLWIGTLGGLSRYDGHTFTNYSVRDGLPSNTVNTLEIDAAGNLWIGTEKGLVFYDGHRFKQFTFQSPENLRGNTVTDIARRPDGGVWCIAGRKLYAIREGKVQSIAHPLPTGNVSAIYSAGSNLYLGISNADSYYILTKNRWIGHRLLPLGQPYSITGFFEDRQRALWLLTTAGIAEMKEQELRWRISPQLNPVYSRGITAMAQAPDGSYWIGSRSGAIRMTDTTIRRYGKANGFTDNNIFSVLRDVEGNIWLGSDGQGIFRFSGAPFTALDESMSLPSAQIMGLATDGEDGLFLGTYDAGLFHYHHERITPIAFPGNNTPTIVTFAKNGSGSLWIGMRGEGLWRYQKGSFRQFTAKDYKVPASGITALRIDAANRLWIGFAEGAALYEGDSFRALPLHDPVVDFLSLPDGSILLATGNGLKLYKNELVTPFTTGTEADAATAQCLALQGGYLWIGTNDNGVIAFDTATRKATIINKAAGLRSDFIYNLYAAPDGNVWAGTGFGIYSLRMDNGKPVISFYGRGQGVTGIESNHNAVLGLPDGSIWFGTTNGAMHYRPGIVKSSAKPVSVVLQSVKLFGDAITDTAWYSGTAPFYGVPQQLDLPYKENNLTFTFQAISLGDIADVNYRYRMAGLEGGWSEWSSTNTVTYSALPPGKFTFEVQCSAPGNNGKLQSLAYPFRIRTPFHKTGLFRLLVLAACILLGVSLQYAANRRRHARLQMIDALRREEQAKVRERTAEDFHDEVGNKLTRINVLTNVLKSKLGALPPDAERIIGQIQDNTAQLYSGTRDILWSLKPSNDSLYEIIHRIRDFGQDLFGDTEIAFTFSGLADEGPHYRLPLDMSRNLIMIFKEAMNNCMKYAAPTEVGFTARREGKDTLVLELADNGKGFSPQTVKRGNGLMNMETRAKRLNGHLDIITAPANGTMIKLTLKIPQSRE